MFLLDFLRIKSLFFVILSIDLCFFFCYSIITNQLKEGSTNDNPSNPVAGRLRRLRVGRGWLGGEFWLQVVLFLAVSCAALACLRPLIRKFVAPKITPTNADSLIGTMAILSADVDNLKGEGTVVLRGVEWSARSTSGDPIPAGATVQIDKIEGVRVYVTPVHIRTEV